MRHGIPTAAVNVLVLTDRVPFVYGAAEELCEHLVRNLRVYGAQAEAVWLPFSSTSAERLIEDMLISRSLQLLNVDRVIALRFPAYLVPHPNKVFWLFDHHRHAFEGWDALQGDRPDDARGEQIQSFVGRADHLAFAEAQHVYSADAATAHVLRRYDGVSSTVLTPPLNDPELFGGADPEGYVFIGGRVSAGARQALLVRALRHASEARLIIAGPADSPEDAEQLRRLVEEERVADRVQLVVRPLPRPQLADLVNRSSAVAHVPYAADQAWYATLEAFQAGKPVVTTSDAVGLLDIVKHGETGLIAEPTPQSLGDALQQLSRDPGRTAQMGIAGRQSLIAGGFDWPTTIQRLLS